MSGKTSDRIKLQKEQIMSVWQKRATREVESANSVTNIALRNSLPIYLEHLSEALAKNRKMDLKSVAFFDAEALRIGRLHGADRAGSVGYELNEVIFEYHLLRSVIFEVLEVDGQLTQMERDIIFDSIEQAVNNAAVKFSEVHADIQQKFVNTLTHDLKTPLASAKINAQLILKQKDLPEVSKKAATKIIANLDRLNNMIHDLLDASKVRAGEELQLQFVQCDLNRVVREVTEEMSAIHGDRFVIESKEEIPGNWACDGLRRTVENLVGNAVKYSTPDTPITITLRKLIREVELIVHNEGKPIAEADQALLFEQYRRTKSAKESANTGWGIGLTLVKGVVDAQKGTVRVKSMAGEGTSFIISLPDNDQPT